MMARYHISLVSTSPDTSYLFRDSSSKTNQHFLDSKESYSPQVKSLQKLFNFLIYILCFSTNKMFSCFRFYFLWFWILHICRCSRRICLLMPLMRDSYCSLGKQFTNLYSRVGTYQVTVRVLWHGGGVTHDEHNPVWRLLQGHWRGLKAKSRQDRGDWTSAGGWEHQQLQ